MKFLFDTSVLIPAEPTSASDVENLTEPLVRLLALLEKGEHQVLVHPASIKEIKGDNNSMRRELRQLLLAKYPPLDPPPEISETLRARFGPPPANRHDQVDEQLVAAVDADAVNFLVTGDHRLLRKARRAGFGARVVTPADALAAVQCLLHEIPDPPPAVNHVFCYQLNSEDPFFDSLRSEYLDFDEWFTKCRLEHRDAWVIREGPRLAALCITRPKATDRRRSLKLCTFKVADAYRGLRYGELLLKAVFSYASRNNFASIYLTVFPHHQELVSLLEEFGFVRLDRMTALNELVMEKPLEASADEYEAFSPLAFNVKFGPRRIKSKGVSTFVVPIVPEYHARLFPDLERQGALFPGRSSYGNAMRKAYLCHSPTRQVSVGSVLMFYRSIDTRCVSAIGVAEEAFVSSSPDEVIGRVGSRTVFSYREIADMCQREVLAVLFRYAGAVRVPISFDELVGRGLLSSAPQSIVQLRGGDVGWLRHQVEELL